MGEERGGGGAVVGGGGGGDGFIDRSKVRILLCDNDLDASMEVLTLLRKCSYQVTLVKSARQVIDALNAEGADIDIILTEVDLPLAKGVKLLKYITRDSNLRRIPIIMMSSQDEVSVVVKCLRLGAADYLVKPLRSNELLNLWTHMWRRRRMLGLTEKNILSFDVDVVASDPSDGNTNSTTLFSDDTDEKSRKNANPDICMSAAPHNTDLIASVSLATTPVMSLGASQSHMEIQNKMGCCSKNTKAIDRQTGSCLSAPKKTTLKLGDSSAFFTYVKSNMNAGLAQGATNLDVNNGRNSKEKEKTPLRIEPSNAIQTFDNGVGKHVDGNSNGKGTLEAFSVEKSCTPLVMEDSEQQRNLKESLNLQLPREQRNDPLHSNSGTQTHSSYSYYMPGIMNQMMMPPSALQEYQKNIYELRNHAVSTPSQFAQHLPQCPPYACYPYNLCIQPGQIPTTNHWPSTHGNPPPTEVKPVKIDRREAALIKFRQKRKERCFAKKIRYVNRKKLAERRPRVRGQFVRKMNGVNVDLNGLPSPDPEFDAEEEEEEYDDEHASRDSSNDNDG